MEFEEKLPANSKLFCCVYGCNSQSKRSRHLSFHSFPKANVRKVLIHNKRGISESVDIRKIWINTLKMGKEPSNYMRVCSLHFTEADYVKHASGKERKHLLKTAVPSQNLPSSSIPSTSFKPRSLKQRSPKVKKPAEVVVEEIEQVVHTQDCVEAIEEERAEPTEDEKLAVEALLSLGNKTFKDVGVQVNTDTLRTISDSITTDGQLNSLTGLHSLKLLEGLEKAVQMVVTDLRPHRLTIRDRIILTMTKLKNDVSYVVLSILFGGVTSQTCKKIFFEMVPKLSEVLCGMVAWPSKEEILANLPKCFEHYQNVRLVLDCTEIPVQSSKCLCCRIKTHSSYKSQPTIKYMTGVTPAGLISFVSKGYGGRASDKAIFEQSRVIEKLIPHQDAIMVDKGFLIDDLCDSYGIKLIRPPFLRKKKTTNS